MGGQIFVYWPKLCTHPVGIKVGNIYWSCTHYCKIFEYFFFYSFLITFCAIKINQKCCLQHVVSIW